MKHRGLIARTLSILIFLAVLFLGARIVIDSRVNQHDKVDLAEINHIKYGLLNLNTWKAEISKIVSDEIMNLDMKVTAKQLKGTIEKQLIALINKVYEKVTTPNHKSLDGRIKQLLIESFVDIEKVKKDVPSYADALIAELAKPANERHLKAMATKNLQRYFDSTFEHQDTSRLDAIQASNGVKTVKEARDKISGRIAKRDQILKLETLLVLVLSVLLFVLTWFERSKPGRSILILLPTLLVLLAVGVATPMIDLEAKITEMSFYLLGHKIVFENQILYFQSKSVVDVFWLMMTHPALQMKIVGLLMVIFSIVFPLLKLTASVFYHYDYKGSRENRYVRFFAFKSGKWSMADVLVVAIFMAYIGFNGIMTTQLDKMGATLPKDIVFIATNGTALQFGFYIFLSYVILALVFSIFVESASTAKSWVPRLKKAKIHMPLASTEPSNESETSSFAGATL